ncbi:MAG: hypothetical protein M3P33_00460 [bacterium]|nr:hypothetical protein [bacterium]
MDEQEQPIDILSTKEIVTQINEHCSGRENGNFFQYISPDLLKILNADDKISFNGKKSFAEIVTSNRFNPNKLPDHNLLGYYFLEAIGDFLVSDSEYDSSAHVKLLKGNKDEVKAMVDSLEGDLVKIDASLDGVASTYHQAIEDHDTTSCMEYFKRIGGEKLMINLEQSGWDVFPNGAFSDLISVTAGAPIILSRVEKDVIVEMNFTADDLSVSDIDNNDHKVLVRQISKKNLTHVYTYEMQAKLWDQLQKRYPLYFETLENRQFSDFARKKPLNELLHEIGII